MKYPTPKLPVLASDTFAGARQADTPCLLDLSATHFTVSGRAAILLALEALSIRAGDQILVPSYHCPTMVAPIVALGAEPVFYPINDHGAPDMQWVQAHATPSTKAMLVAHLFGLPQPLADLRHWCTANSVYLVEDCAHALFGSHAGHTVGSTGDMAIASLTKFLPVVEGGCLVNNLAGTQVPALRAPGGAAQVKAAFDIVHTSVNAGRLPLLAPLMQAVTGLRGLLKPAAPVPHINANAHAAASATPELPESDSFTIDTFKAHTALTGVCHWMAQHAHRQRIVDRRRANYRFFTQAFASVAGMHPLLPQLPEHCAPYVFPLWVDVPDPGYAELRRLDYPVSRWDWLWPGVPDMAQDQGKLWSHHVLQLACHQDLTAAELQYMVATLQRVYA